MAFSGLYFILKDAPSITKRTRPAVLPAPALVPLIYIILFFLLIS